MNLKEVSALQQRGRFTEALALLESVRVATSDRLESDVLRAELLERIGRYQDARAMADRLIGLNNLPLEHRARCEFTLGLIDTDEGRTDFAQVHFQRSITAARTAKNLHLSCVAQLRLILLLADKAGHAAVAPLLSLARADITRLGNPIVTATLHILMGAMETRRGLVESGVQHTRLGLRLLDKEEDLWLATTAENTLVAAALMRCDIAGGIEVAKAALEKAERSGAAAMRRATLANLGNLYHQQGHFSSALHCFEDARAILTSCGEPDNATLDSMALTLLAQGRVDDAEATLNMIDAGVSASADWRLYGNRHSRLTRTMLFLRNGDFIRAIDQADEVLALSSAVGDCFLNDAATILRADILRRMGRHGQFLHALEEIVPSLQRGEPHLYARYLALIACGLATIHTQYAELLVACTD